MVHIISDNEEEERGDDMETHFQNMSLKRKAQLENASMETHSLPWKRFKAFSDSAPTVPHLSISYYGPPLAIDMSFVNFERNHAARKRARRSKPKKKARAKEMTNSELYFTYMENVEKQIHQD